MYLVWTLNAKTKIVIFIGLVCTTQKTSRNYFSELEHEQPSNYSELYYVILKIKVKIFPLLYHFQFSPHLDIVDVCTFSSLDFWSKFKLPTYYLVCVHCAWFTEPWQFKNSDLFLKAVKDILERKIVVKNRLFRSELEGSIE